jgi:spore maturation protein CgeB
MRIAFFCQSLVSDWNHGNAHFLRGIALELIARGHDARIFEPLDSWSFQNLKSSYGESVLDDFRRAFPTLSSTRYDPNALDLESALDGVDVVLVHEWNTANLIRRLAQYRKNHRILLFFHDTHHRSVTDTAHVMNPALEEYDGILAFGESVTERYRRLGWGSRAWTWHEAADVRTFKKLEYPSHRRSDLVWIGNWGDEERSEELAEFFMGPVHGLGLSSEAYGVRYPEHAVQRLKSAGIQYQGWAPNYEVPNIFARFRLTVHIPRRPYREALPGIPTIRVFEALACGIPLISAPWEDSEGLFRRDRDFLTACNGAHMTRLLNTLLHDQAAAQQIASSGLETILARHTCAHRLDELFRICDRLDVGNGESRPAFAIEAPACCGEEG